MADKRKIQDALVCQPECPTPPHPSPLDISEEGPNVRCTEQHSRHARREQKVSPVKVSVQGLTPAKRLDVPKSEIFRTPL